jgi:hypothetical protein
MKLRFPVRRLTVATSVVAVLVAGAQFARAQQKSAEIRWPPSASSKTNHLRQTRG